MNLKIKIFLRFFLLLVFASCVNQNKQLKEATFWKYNEGFYIGDSFDFNNKYIEIQNDTIYKNRIPTALFLKIENRMTTGDKLLHIKDIATGKKGVYIKK